MVLDNLGGVVVELPFHIHRSSIFFVISFVCMRIRGEKPLKTVHEGHVVIPVFNEVEIILVVCRNQL